MMASVLFLLASLAGVGRHHALAAPPLLALPFLVTGVLRASTFDFGSVTVTTDGKSLAVN